MRGRIFLLVLLALCFGLGARADCDLSLKTRASALAAYVLNGEACLADLPEGYKTSDAIERAFVARINTARRAHGLAALTVRPELRTAARWHSLDMAVNNFFNHKGPDGTQPGDRIAAFDRSLLASETRENIAALKGPGIDHTTVAARLHGGLMDSLHHRETILAGSVTHLAVGVITSDRGVWVTELFVRQDGAFEKPVPLILHAGSWVDEPATLDGWDWAGLALRRGSDVDDLTTRGGTSGRVPRSVQGLYTFTVRGEQTIPGGGGRLYMHFSGPRVEIVPPGG